MSDERWRQISRIYRDAAALVPDDRAAFLREACGADDALRAEIESLLMDDSRTDALLEPTDSRMDLIGQRIGVYEIRSLLGVGGMGEVYRGRDTKLGREVAIKVLPHVFTTNAERLARFDREARILATLNHPHIATIYGLEDVGSSADSERPIHATLVYRTGRSETRSLVWIDRNGTASASLGDLNQTGVRLSPDARQIAFHEPRDGISDDIYSYDLERRVTTRLTNDSGADQTPVWSPDGRRIGFRRDRGGKGEFVLYEMRADGDAAERELFPSEPGIVQTLLHWTTDLMVFSKGKLGEQVTDLWAVPLSGDRKPFRYFANFRGTLVTLSPTSRWIAYVSNDTSQVIVQSFPDPSQSRQQISSDGGGLPRWSRDGRELFYVKPYRRMVAVSVVTEGTFAVQKSTELFMVPAGWGSYEVTADGQRFLFNVPASATPTPITVILNWTAGLKNQ